jgi:hypothetical protein
MKAALAARYPFGQLSALREWPMRCVAACPMLLFR